MSSRILIYAQVPPPVHGQSVMVGLLMHGLRNSGQCDLAQNPDAATQAAAGIVYYHINPRLSEDLGDIGRWRVQKLFLVFKHIFQAIVVRFKYRLDAFYFVPAPPKREGMYRDWAVLFFCRPFFRKVIFHWHCIGQPEFIEKKLNVFERTLARFMYGRAELSIALSNYSHAEASYFKPIHAEIVPNGIPDPCPRFAEEVLPLRQKRAEAFAAIWSGQIEPAFYYEVFFLAGRMTPKGLFDAMAAVTRANRLLAEKKSALRMRLTVAGTFEGDERQRFEAAAQELNATQRPDIADPLTVDAGWADEEKKKQLYRQADCFIFPTTYAAESFGLVLAEAMAHGCAVITTRWQAVPEVLPSGYPHIVEPHDIDAMAAALLACVTDPVGTTLRDYFLARFTSERFAARMIEVLSAL